MFDNLKLLDVWQQKEQLTLQIEEIAISSDWYRGGRKIGKLRREYKQIANIIPEVDELFATRIDTAHQTYMDRLAVHKLRGPSDKQAIKATQIQQIERYSQLLQASIDQALKVIVACRGALVADGQPQEAAENIEQLQSGVAHKQNLIKANDAMLDSLNSSYSVVSCSANIKPVAV